ncbi:RNA polymerase sigma factor FliA [Kineobactrum sediminis]|uniref:RNA polymerase sigma factor n=1 Tax=Kineobactrum sediminis TaxID=1905677 RepID=A0A2N5Y7U3_9GAMM|nr:RNA polymerase sigma factor FliA [Kineobactrum sediminis]
MSAEYAAVRNLPVGELVETYALLVRRIAYHLGGRLPDSVDVNDLIQAGMLGLMEAAKKYTGDRGANFETYAGIRIRGAMLDELRRMDWVPRSVHRKVRSMVGAIRIVEARSGSRATDLDVAAEMGVSLDDYHEIAREAVSCRMFSTEELASVDSEMQGSAAVASPEQQAEEESIAVSLATTIASLPERERMIMSLYYNDELNLREIGEVLGVSESRVCQLHGQALVRIRARMLD